VGLADPLRAGTSRAPNDVSALLLASPWRRNDVLRFGFLTGRGTRRRAARRDVARSE